MISLLLQDGRDPRGHFHWYGAIDEARLDEWLRENDLQGKLPEDLIALWAATGGGDYFESETILGPYGDSYHGEDVLGQREFLKGRGLASYLLPFATGVFMAAVDLRTRDIVSLDSRTLEVVETFPSVDEWYRNTARREFAPFYGLPPA